MPSIIKRNSKNLFNLFLFFYVIFCLYFSVKTGISADEFIELYNWQLSKDAIKDFFGFNNYGYTNLFAYDWKFHGIAHHFFSKPYTYIIGSIFKIENLSLETSNVLLNHSFTFLIFFLSGIFAKKILNLIIEDDNFSRIFLVFYLLYPYLLGHGFYNPKDIPFLCVWLILTYTNINLFIKIKNNISINIYDVLILSVLTAFLFSIRISGILILIQYLITFLITLSLSKKTFLNFIKIYAFKLFLFLLFTSTFTLFFYPVLWKNPLLIVDSINQMRNINYGVCTLTLGKCMDSLKLPSSYIFVWLFFKLPLLTLLGFIVFPFIEKKIFSKANSQIILGSILLTLISIIFILIFIEVNLYDEIRHILFIVPLILIASFSTLYFFSKKILLYLSIMSILTFSIQNFIIYPYQYAWFNPIINFVDINKNFEVDYWGVSGRNIASKINKNEFILSNKDKCIYVSPTHLIKPFLSKDYNCVKPFFSIFPKSNEKYILVKYTRNIRRENPSDCKLVFKESSMLFKKELIMGEVYVCN
jgi:hypothetical protein